MELQNKCNCKSIDALRGGWTLIGITKKGGKIKRVDALRGLCTLIGIAKKEG